MSTPVENLLRPDPLIRTLEQLGHRISERFPESGLHGLNRELRGKAAELSRTLDHIHRPQWWRRIISLLVIVSLLAVSWRLAFAIFELLKTESGPGVSEFLQGVDAAANMVILLVMAGYFFWKWERKSKRDEALRSLHDLRSFAHRVDLIQLVKDPVPVSRIRRTRSSPERKLSPVLLHRYLDYCSEMLSIIAALAALHAFELPDPEVLEAVNDLENYTQGLSQKIWMKISLLRL